MKLHLSNENSVPSLSIRLSEKQWPPAEFLESEACELDDCTAAAVNKERVANKLGINYQSLSTGVTHPLVHPKAYWSILHYRDRPTWGFRNY
jgi:hypothetical protein